MTCLYRRAPGKDERKSRIKLKKDGRSIAFEVFSDCSEAKPKLITEPTVFASSRNRKKKIEKFNGSECVWINSTVQFDCYVWCLV